MTSSLIQPEPRQRRQEVLEIILESDITDTQVPGFSEKKISEITYRGHFASP